LSAGRNDIELPLRPLRARRHILTFSLWEKVRMRAVLAVQASHKTNGPLTSIVSQRARENI